MGNLYALFMMGLLVDKIEGSFVGGGPGATEKCIHETATYESGEVGGICNGTPIEITRQSYDFNVCEYIDDANGPYWTKYYQCDTAAIKSMKFTTEFGCDIGYESKSTYEPTTIKMNYCDLNWWNLIGAPYQLS